MDEVRRDSSSGSLMMISSAAKKDDIYFIEQRNRDCRLIETNKALVEWNIN